MDTSTHTRTAKVHIVHIFICSEGNRINLNEGLLVSAILQKERERAFRNGCGRVADGARGGQGSR